MESCVGLPAGLLPSSHPFIRHHPAANCSKFLHRCPGVETSGLAQGLNWYAGHGKAALGPVSVCGVPMVMCHACWLALPIDVSYILAKSSQREGGHQARIPIPRFGNVTFLPGSGGRGVKKRDDR